MKDYKKIKSDKKLLKKELEDEIMESLEQREIERIEEGEIRLVDENIVRLQSHSDLTEEEMILIAQSLSIEDQSVGAQQGDFVDNNGLSDEDALEYALILSNRQ